MTTPKSWINAFFAWMHKEIDASPLEAYQRAGNVVFNLVLEAEMQRQQGMSLWDTPAHLQIQNLCLWNALVLQTLGDQVLNADYRLNPSTVGYVPLITAKQIENFYHPVETWLNHAYQAQKNTQFSIKELGIPLPALLPTWLNVKEMLSSNRYKAEITRYLDGILSAAKTLALHMDVQFEQLSLEKIDQKHHADAHKLQQLYASISTTLEYVIQLWGQELVDGLYPKVDQALHQLINTLWLLGQLLAMPCLIQHIHLQHWLQPQKMSVPINNTPVMTATTPKTSTETEATPAHLWQLTAPIVRQQKQHDSYSIALLTRMWRNDPQPQRTLHLQHSIEQALALGHISLASHQHMAYFKQCPWSPIYITNRPMVLAGDPLRAQQVFAYVCDADRANQAEPNSFGNRILRL